MRVYMHIHLLALRTANFTQARTQIRTNYSGITQIQVHTDIVTVLDTVADTHINQRFGSFHLGFTAALDWPLILSPIQVCVLCVVGVSE